MLSAPGSAYTGGGAWVHGFRLLGDPSMSSPRYPGRDLRLERLSDRAGGRPAPVGEAAQVRWLGGPAGSAREFVGAYQALIDAVFTAPGAAEWLAGLRRKVAALLAVQEAARGPAVACDAIRLLNHFWVVYRMFALNRNGWSNEDSDLIEFTYRFGRISVNDFDQVNVPFTCNPCERRLVPFICKD